MKTKTYEENTGRHPCLSLFPGAANDQTKALRVERKGGKTTGFRLPEGKPGADPVVDGSVSTLNCYVNWHLSSSFMV